MQNALPVITEFGTASQHSLGIGPRGNTVERLSWRLEDTVNLRAKGFEAGRSRAQDPRLKAWHFRTGSGGGAGD